MEESRPYCYDIYKTPGMKTSGNVREALIENLAVYFIQQQI